MDDSLSFCRIDVDISQNIDVFEVLRSCNRYSHMVTPNYYSTPYDNIRLLKAYNLTFFSSKKAAITLLSEVLLDFDVSKTRDEKTDKENEIADLKKKASE
ncbi:MAG: hypothetical protein GX478_06195 [Erysipelotrichaceae bacterium]|nr:hypothetical protein [Erysipelotrichaceae bacterium]